MNSPDSLTLSMLERALGLWLHFVPGHRSARVQRARLLRKMGFWEPAFTELLRAFPCDHPYDQSSTLGEQSESSLGGSMPPRPGTAPVAEERVDDPDDPQIARVLAVLARVDRLA